MQVPAKEITECNSVQKEKEAASSRVGTSHVFID